LPTTRTVKKKTSSLVAIGRIVRCIGIRGEVKVQPLTPFLERFEDCESLFYGTNEKDVQSISFASTAIRGAYVVCRFESVTTRNEAESLVGNILYVPEEEKIQLAENQWFVDDIVGCKVFIGEKPVGSVSEVLTFPANDVWVIVTNSGKEVLFPAAREFIVEVDVPKKFISLRPPLGIFDEEQ